MPRSPRVVPAAIAGAVIVALALAGAGAPVLGAGHAVRIVDKNAGSYGESAFSPRSISIRTGDRVTWTNDSTTQHNVTFATFASATYMEPGTRYGHTFSGPGTFRYTCTLHGFTGTVIVTGTAVTPKPTAKPTPAVAASPTSAPSPEPSASPSAVAVATAAAPAASPGPTSSPSSPASSGDSTLPLLLVFGLVAAGIVGLAVFARRRT